MSWSSDHKKSDSREQEDDEQRGVCDGCNVIFWPDVKDVSPRMRSQSRWSIACFGSDLFFLLCQKQNTFTNFENTAHVARWQNQNIIIRSRPAVSPTSVEYIAYCAVYLLARRSVPPLWQLISEWKQILSNYARESGEEERSPLVIPLFI